MRIPFGLCLLLPLAVVSNTWGRWEVTTTLHVSEWNGCLSLEQALKEQDPLVVKVLRLSYEYLQDRNAFDVQAQYEEDEDGNEYPLEIEDQENFLYLLNLLKNAEHKINREEIKDYRTALKQELY